MTDVHEHSIGGFESCLPFDTSIREALASAESSTCVFRHSRGIDIGSTSQSASVGTFGNASNLGPSRSEHLLSVSHRRCGSSIRASRLRAGTCPDSIASWEKSDRVLVTNVLVDNFAFITTGRSRLRIHDGVQRRAISNISGRVGTVVDGILEKSGIGPTHLEVTMEAKTAGITISPDPSASTIVRELINGDDHLVEDGDEMDRMRGRTLSAVVNVGRVGHM